MMTVLKRQAWKSNDNNQNNNNTNDLEEVLLERRYSSDRFQLKRSEIREQAQKKWQKRLGCAIVAVGLFLSLTFLFPFAEEKKSFTTKEELCRAVKQYLGQDLEQKKKIKAVYGDPIGSWDVSQVTDFSYFGFGDGFNEDISK
jgi:hypothetical protein